MSAVVPSQPTPWPPGADPPPVGILEGLPAPCLRTYVQTSLVLPVESIPEETVGPLARAVSNIIKGSTLTNIRLNSAGQALTSVAPSHSPLFREVLRLLPHPNGVAGPRHTADAPKPRLPTPAPAVEPVPTDPAALAESPAAVRDDSAPSAATGSLPQPPPDGGLPAPAADAPGEPKAKRRKKGGAGSPERAPTAAAAKAKVTAKAPAEVEAEGGGGAGGDAVGAFLARLRAGAVQRGDFCDVRLALEAGLPALAPERLALLVQQLLAVVKATKLALEAAKHGADPADSVEGPEEGGRKRPRKEPARPRWPWEGVALEPALGCAALATFVLAHDAAPPVSGAEDALEAVAAFGSAVVGQLVACSSQADWKREAKGPTRKALGEALGGVRALLAELRRALRGQRLGELGAPALLGLAARCLRLPDLPGQDAYLLHPACDILRALFHAPAQRHDILTELLAQSRAGGLRQRVALLHGGETIGAGSAVLMACIQACAPSPGSMALGSSPADNSAERVWRDAQRTTELVVAAFLDAHFGSQASIDKEDLDVAHRQLQQLFDDTLACLSRPEWPAAEPLLRQLLRVLERQCLGPDAPPRPKPLQDRLRTQFVDQLGALALALRREAGRVPVDGGADGQPAEPTPADWYTPLPPESTSPKKEPKGGRKRKAKVEEPVKVEADPPPFATAPAPEIDQPDNPVQLWPRREARRSAVFHFLTRQAGADPHHPLLAARQLAVCRWAAHDGEVYEGRLGKLEAQGKVTDSQRRRWQQEAEHKQAWLSGLLARLGAGLVPLSSEDASAAEYQRARDATRALYAARHSSLLHPGRYMYYVKLLFRVFTDDGLQTSAKDRSRSVKALARLVEEDPALLGAVLQHIREGLTSPSIAVREAVLDLMGTILLRLNAYQAYLTAKAAAHPNKPPPDLSAMRGQMVALALGRLGDKGASVVNRAVRILGAVLTQRLLKDNPAEEVACCCRLVAGGVGTEAALRKPILRLFREMWFGVGPAPGEEAEAEDAAEDGEGRPASAVGPRGDALATALHLVDVVAAGLEGPLLEFAEDHPMVRLLASLLSPDPADKKAAAGLERVQRRLDEFAAALVTHLVALPPSGGGDGADCGAQSASCCLATLHLLALVRPTALQDRLLHPVADYLRDPRAAPALLYHALGLVAHVSRHTPALAEAEVAEVRRAVVAEATRLIKTYKAPVRDGAGEDEAKLSNWKVTIMAVQCLCHLCYLESTRPQYAPDVAAVFHHVYVYLKRFLEMRQQFEALKQYVLRYLLLLAWFLRGFPWQQHRLALPEWLGQGSAGAGGAKAEGAELCGDPVGACFALLERYREYVAHVPCDEDTRRQLQSGVLTALGSVCICDPKGYLQRVMPDIEAGLQDEGVQYHALVVLRDFFHHDEHRLKAAAERQGSGLQDIQQADTGMSCFAAQKPLPLVLDCLLSPLRDVRAAALDVVDVSVRHGLVLPALCIEGIIAVLQDPPLAPQAAALLQFFEEHARPVLRNVATAGVIRSYLFAVHATGCDPPSVRGVAEATPGQRGSVHQPLYAALQRHKEERNAFLDQAVRQVMRPLALPKGLAERYHRGLAEDPRHRLAFVRFLVESLLSLPYAREDEVLYVLTRVDVEVNLSAEASQAELKAVLELATTTGASGVVERLVPAVALAALLLLKKGLMAECGVAPAKLERFRNGLLKQCGDVRRRALRDGAWRPLADLFDPLLAAPVPPLAQLHLMGQTFQQLLAEDDQAYLKGGLEAEGESTEGPGSPKRKGRAAAAPKPRAKPAAARRGRRKAAESSESDDDDAEEEDSDESTSTESDSAASDGDAPPAAAAPKARPKAKPAAPKPAPKPAPRRSQPAPQKARRRFSAADGDDAAEDEDDGDDYAPGKRQRKR